LHQLLGEYLARLNLGGSLGRTKNRNAPDYEAVNDALSQGRLRSNNGKVNLVGLSYLNQSINISRTKSKVVGNLSRTGIARSDIDFLYFGALG